MVSQPDRGQNRHRGLAAPLQRGTTAFQLGLPDAVANGPKLEELFINPCHFPNGGGMKKRSRSLYRDERLDFKGFVLKISRASRLTGFFVCCPSPYLSLRRSRSCRGKNRRGDATARTSAPRVGGGVTSRAPQANSVRTAQKYVDESSDGRMLQHAIPKHDVDLLPGRIALKGNR